MAAEGARNQLDFNDRKRSLRSVQLLSELPDESLEQLAERVEVWDVSAGQTVIEEGRPADSLFVIVDGELEVTKRVGDSDLTLAVRRAGDFVGERGLFEDAPRSASVRALENSQLLVVSQGAFRDVLAGNPTALMALLRTMTSRLEGTETLLMQHQKMAALGTLAAGLAHELNNPAAAIGRTAEHLQEILAIWERLIGDLGRTSLNDRQVALVAALRHEAQELAATASHLGSTDLLDREEAVQSWLEDHQVPEAWNLAPDLAAAGWSEDNLAKLAADFSPSQVSAVVQWLSVSGSVYSLVDQLRKSAGAISEIVQAVKTYAHLGQAPIQEVDLRKSIENTLVILRHQLKTGVDVVREYDEDVPPVEAHAIDLNQVWTNIIHNAIDAMGGHGQITIRIARENGESVRVDITDNGPGISPELQYRIFEPFFTTKEPGVGTGLGLYIAYNIVVVKHRGSITMESVPGKTRFTIILPIRRVRPSSTEVAEELTTMVSPIM